MVWDRARSSRLLANGPRKKWISTKNSTPPKKPSTTRSVVRIWQLTSIQRPGSLLFPQCINQPIIVDSRESIPTSTTEFLLDKKMKKWNPVIWLDKPNILKQRQIPSNLFFFFQDFWSIIIETKERKEKLKMGFSKNKLEPKWRMFVVKISFFFIETNLMFFFFTLIRFFRYLCLSIRKNKYLLTQDKKLISKFSIDNIDTRTALDAIRDIVSQCNVYTKECKNSNTLLLRDIAVYITRMLVVFGAISSQHDGIGFPIDDHAAASNVSPFLCQANN